MRAKRLLPSNFGRWEGNCVIHGVECRRGRGRGLRSGVERCAAARGVLALAVIVGLIIFVGLGL